MNVCLKVTHGWPGKLVMMVTSVIYYGIFHILLPKRERCERAIWLLFVKLRLRFRMR